MGKVLVTGGAGFIGSHVTERLLARGDAVTVLDNFDPYYDPRIKRRTAGVLTEQGAVIVEGDIRQRSDLNRALEGVDRVIHLAARPGVRVSLDDPATTAAINIEGTKALLDAIHARPEARRLVFASSSSVYGEGATAPFQEDEIGEPLSPYALSKRGGEQLCAAIAAPIGLGVVALRFFTVYGPRGRPDMSIGKFARLALEKKPLPLFGDGSVVRDFTYIDDIVTGVVAALDLTRPGSGYQVINIGGGNTATMKELIALIEAAVGEPVTIEELPPARGDMPLTHADLTRAQEVLGFRSTVDLAEGVRRTVAWMREQLAAEDAS